MQELSTESVGMPCDGGVEQALPPGMHVQRRSNASFDDRGQPSVATSRRYGSFALRPGGDFSSSLASPKARRADASCSAGRLTVTDQQPQEPGRPQKQEPQRRGHPATAAACTPSGQDAPQDMVVHSCTALSMGHGMQQAQAVQVARTQSAAHSHRQPAAANVCLRRVQRHRGAAHALRQHGHLGQQQQAAQAVPLRQSSTAPACERRTPKTAMEARNKLKRELAQDWVCRSEWTPPLRLPVLPQACANDPASVPAQ